MYRSWQDCCRRGENRSWPSVSVESVNSEYWCLNNAIVYAFIMRLTVEERVLRSTFKLNILYECLLQSSASRRSTNYNQGANKKRDKQSMYSEILRTVRVAIVTVEER